MAGRFISDRTAIQGLTLAQKAGVTRLDRMHVSINLSRGGMACLRGKVSISPDHKKVPYVAVLYSGRHAFALEAGRSQGEHMPPVKRSDRRWLRFSSDPWIIYPGSFSAAEVKKTGGFNLKFPPTFLNNNLYESIVVIGRANYLDPAPKKWKTFVFDQGTVKDETAFARYLEFLKFNRAYLSDFMLRTLVANPGVLLAAHLAENCTINFE